jgi:hypothetical protein
MCQGLPLNALSSINDDNATNFPVISPFNPPAVNSVANDGENAFFKRALLYFTVPFTVLLKLNSAVAIPAHFNAAIAASKASAAGKQPPSSSLFITATGTASGYRPKEKSHAPSASGAHDTLSQWKHHAVEGMYVLPCYYPMCEKRSATSDQPLDNILERLFICFKKLNIQASYDDSFATFGLVLRTAEQLELTLLIWWATKSRSSIYVELDKRQAGCGGFPLQYICRILKAIKCCKSELEDDSICLASHQEMKRGNFEMAERCRKMDMVVGSCVAPHKPVPGRHTSPYASFTCVGDQTLSSLEMVWGLLKQPVTWSHGLELLGTVSDPNRSGVETSMVVSKVILLGVSPMAYGDVCCRGIHEKLVHLMQVLVLDDASGDESMEHLSAYQKDCLLQLVLTCLVNAMEVHSKFVADADSSMDAGEASVLCSFLKSTKGLFAVGGMLQILIKIVRRANTKPHHAYLAVKALFILSSENSIREYVSVAMSTEVPCAALQRAHEVGMHSHELLEAECERLQRVLQSKH